MAVGELAYLSVVDEFEARKGADCLRNFFEKGIALDLTGCAKPGSDGVERGIVIARMADQLPCAFRHCIKNLMQ